MMITIYLFVSTIYWHSGEMETQPHQYYALQSCEMGRARVAVEYVGFVEISQCRAIQRGMYPWEINGILDREFLNGEGEM